MQFRISTHDENSDKIMPEAKDATKEKEDKSKESAAKEKEEKKEEKEKEDGKKEKESAKNKKETASKDPNVKGNSVTLDKETSTDDKQGDKPSLIDLLNKRTSMMDKLVPSKTEKTEFYTKKEMDEFSVKDFVKTHFIAGSKKMDYQPKEIHILLDKVKEAFTKSETLIEVRAPVNICGDIHGQYGDLMRIFTTLGTPFKVRYLFLGDYVDRGRHSLEVILLLFACRIRLPNRVFLLRGNHELANINKVYGFSTELKTRFRNLVDSKALYDHFNEVFAMMPLAAIVEKKVLCMHGGLSPHLNSLDDIRKIQRPLKIVRGLAQDLLWADPEAGVKGFQQNKVRGVSHMFGEDAVHSKCKQLGIDKVIRAHQVVEFGYSFFAGSGLITIFSASRYHEELHNYAAVVQMNAALEMNFIQLKPNEFDQVRHEALKKREQTGNREEEEE